MATNRHNSELLAQAMLDLEVKMKHELRRNTTSVLAKMEKQSQQVNQRVDAIVAKLEAQGSSRHSHRQTHVGAGRGANAHPIGGRSNAYLETRKNRQNSGGGSRPPPPTPIHPPHNQQQRGALKESVNTSSGPMAQQQHPFAKVFNVNKQPPVDNKGAGGHGHGGRHQQTLGTNKSQQQKANLLAAKGAGIYTDDDEDGISASDDGSFSRSDGSTEKPNCDELGSAIAGDKKTSNGEEKTNTVFVKTFEEVGTEVTKTLFVARFDKPGWETEKVPNPSDDIKAANSVVEMISSSEKHQSMSVVVPVAESAALDELKNRSMMKTVTPGATISPVLGGFGRSRRHV